MKLVLLITFLFSHASLAATVEDIEILDVTVKGKVLEYKVRSRELPPESFFFLAIPNEDTQGNEALKHFSIKLLKKDNYIIDLEIRSFSPYPSGSYYNIANVQVQGRFLRQPNNLPAKPLKKRK